MQAPRSARVNHATLALVFPALLLAAACDDPASDATAATVSEAPRDEDPEPTPGASEIEEVPFDDEGSSVAWEASKVTATHEGSFGDFSGTIFLLAGDLSASRVEVEIQTASIVADVDRLTQHLRSDDFLDVQVMPTARFVSTSIEASGDGDATHTVTGQLTLHGETKTLTFPATIAVTDAEVSAEAEFSIDRQDFGINYPGMPDDLIRDRVVIRLDIHARR